MVKATCTVERTRRALAAALRAPLDPELRLLALEPLAPPHPLPGATHRQLLHQQRHQQQQPQPTVAVAAALLASALRGPNAGLWFEQLQPWRTFLERWVG